MDPLWSRTGNELVYRSVPQSVQINRVSYTVTGDTMSGTLIILPDKSLGRRVSVHRVSEDKLPKAPALKEYDG